MLAAACCAALLLQICGLFNKGRNNQETHYLCPTCLQNGLNAGTRQPLAVRPAWRRCMRAVSFKGTACCHGSLLQLQQGCPSGTMGRGGSWHRVQQRCPTCAVLCFAAHHTSPVCLHLLRLPNRLVILSSL